MMQSLFIAKLKDGWHNNQDLFTAECHDLLDNVQAILFHNNISTQEEAYDTLENEAYYNFIIRSQREEESANDYFKMILDTTEMLRQLDLAARTPYVAKEDIEYLCVLDVTESFYNAVQEMDLTYFNTKIRDLPVLQELGRITQ